MSILKSKTVTPPEPTAEEIQAELDQNWDPLVSCEPGSVLDRAREALKNAGNYRMVCIELYHQRAIGNMAGADVPPREYGLALREQAEKRALEEARQLSTNAEGAFYNAELGLATLEGELRGLRESLPINMRANLPRIAALTRASGQPPKDFDLDKMIASYRAQGRIDPGNRLH